ncbi:MAG: glycosyltransferase family 4 protein [Jaaginema sp. PMC 1079.18]|nr:glycosyltransferase family 4 protein [Jaaginema sp. PMC 1080.18]MEC4849652.1 glycosyltransferase family 4 protein [Jaaginema sp. PMC 1079.18]MEC4866088.1 glycosyltransferase family 4 protein [Jaaginema sp. PMC 1078.18]
MTDDCKTPRVAWLLTHRIQYFVNLLDELQQRGNVAVLAVYAHETQSFRDRGFGLNISWDNREQTGFAEKLLSDSAQRTYGPFLNSRSNELGKVLDEFQPDFIYLNGYTHAISIQGWWWAKTHNVPFAIRCDGDTLTQKVAWKSAIRRKLVSVITGDAYRVTHQGRENQQFWRENGATEAQLVWTPCVSDSQVFRVKAFESEGEQAKFRQAHEVAENEVVFVVSGKLIPRKRPADAIKAIAQYRDLPLRLWFLGSGELEGELQALATQLGVSERIYWWGFRNQSEIPKILQAADVLLHPSQADPWPYSILDGAISGLALLLSNRTGSYPDWMATPPAGKAFACGDIDDLGRCLREMEGDRAQLQVYQNAAQQRAQEYTESKFCQIFENMVFSALV